MSSFIDRSRSLCGANVLRAQLIGALWVTVRVTAVGAQWPNVPTDTTSYASALDSVVPALLRQYNVPGAAIMLIERGEPSLVRAYGFADGARRIPVTASTVFGVASLSKLATAWGVMRLVDEGKVRLDAPVGRYLSAAHRKLLTFNPDTVSLSQLLSHTAGLSQRSVNGYWPPDTVPSLESEISGVTATGEPILRLIAAPGTSWNYSGGGYALLQLAIEDVSKQRFATYMAKSVFTPLDMTSTSFGNRELRPGSTAYHVDETGAGIVRSGYANLAAAGLYTTLSDFAKLASYDMGRGKGRRHVLTASELTKMETPAPGSRGTYGLGYFIESTPAGPLVGHDGSDVGWNSMYRGLPDRGDAFIMFTSGSNGIPVYAIPLCGWLKWKTGVDRADYCQSGASTAVMTTLYRNGEAAAIEHVARLRATDSKFDIPEAYWNFLAGTMLDRHQTPSALSLLRLIAAVHPTSANAFTKLGDAYVLAQDVAAAIASYRKALELNPNLTAARRSLDALIGKSPR